LFTIRLPPLNSLKQNRKTSGVQANTINNSKRSGARIKYIQQASPNHYNIFTSLNTGYQKKTKNSIVYEQKVLKKQLKTKTREAANYDIIFTWHRIGFII